MNGRCGPPSAAAIRPDLQPHPCWVGLAWALALLAAWTASLIAALLMPAAAELSGAILLPLILLRTMLQTGLFIVGHDAMHGSLLPGSPRWNDRLGRLSLWLYACLPWDSCRRNHRRHHEAPASRLDPDHHSSQRPGPLRWYLRFMASYLTPAQMGHLLGGWLLTLLLLQPDSIDPLARLLLFWTLPLLLSSLQLFVIGTYLPHRQSPERSGDRHRAASLAWPQTLSLFACYHFGYHWEHHRHPQLPWYRLPAARRLMTVPPAGVYRLALPQASR